MATAGLVLAVLVSVIVAAQSGQVRPAAAAPTSTTLSCWMSSTVANAATTQSLSLDVTGAPSQSLPSATFTVTYADQGETAPTTAQGNPVTSETSIRLAVPVPAGAGFVSASLSGGSNVGSGATVTEVPDASSPGGADVVETVPGPIAAGQPFTLPAVVVTLQASATVGRTIATGLLDVPPTGTATVSSDPMLTAVVNTTATSGAVPVTDSCWPSTSPGPTFSTTTVVAVDSLPPTIDLVAPASGAVYTVGQVVDASFSCSDVASYGVATCTGTVASGAAFDTTTVGMHAFTVDATDNRGTPATQTVSYYVRAAPTPTVIGPIDAGPVTLATGSSCSFGGTSCGTPAPPEATYEVSAPVANGGTLVVGDTFTVQWQVYKPGAYSTTPVAGPSLLTWTVPAPTGTEIVGPITSSTTGLLSPTAGQGSLNGAGACTDSTCTTHGTAYGLTLVNGTNYLGTPYTPLQPLTSLTTSWAESSSPAVGTDGIYLDVTYTVRVTTPGTITLPGFPAMSAAGLSTAAVPAPTGVSFDVLDPTPPTISIASPVDGGQYAFGQAVAASYTCSDPLVMITSCTGTVADGAPVDTTRAAPGSIHTFTVTATNSAGNTATATVDYYVIAPPPTMSASSYSVALLSSATLHVLSAATPTAYPVDPSTVVIASQPAYGTVSVNPDGTILYTSTGGASLSDSFTYTVADTVGDRSAPAAVSIVITWPLDVATATSPLAPGLVITQPVPIPVDVLGATVSGTSCSGPPITLDGQPQSACGQITPIVVTNDGGTDAGWTLSGQISDFVTPAAGPAVSCNSPSSYVNQCIPGGNLGWTPKAAVYRALPGSPAQVLAGSTVAPSPIFSPGTTASPPPGLNAAPQVLCQAPANASQGQFTCSAGLVLPVPASAATPGSPGYEATLTLTLS